METYCVRARNTAPDSENRIHDNRTAATHGFRAGLVTGVRFQQPVYEGEEVVVTSSGRDVAASQPDGTVCAAGEILWPETAPPSPALYPEEPLPCAHPAASAQPLAPGRVPGTLHANLSLPDPAFLALKDEALALYQKGILHPAALLTLSNRLLMQNVQLGPWIRGRLAERFERKGHQFVVLDILVVADGERLVQHVRHTAIYRLRPPAVRIEAYS